MADKFIFRGQTTFIDKPSNSVIQNFQNSYIAGDGSSIDAINSELLKLVKLVLQSKDLPSDAKDEASKAIHLVAEQVKEKKGVKLTFKGSLQAIKEVVSKAADIAVPSLGIIKTIMKLLGLE